MLSVRPSVFTTSALFILVGFCFRSCKNEKKIRERKAFLLPQETHLSLPSCSSEKRSEMFFSSSLSLSLFPSEMAYSTVFFFFFPFATKPLFWSVLRLVVVVVWRPETDTASGLSESAYCRCCFHLMHDMISEDFTNVMLFLTFLSLAPESCFRKLEKKRNQKEKKDRKSSLKASRLETPEWTENGVSICAFCECIHVRSINRYIYIYIYIWGNSSSWFIEDSSTTDGRRGFYPA